MISIFSIIFTMFFVTSCSHAPAGADAADAGLGPADAAKPNDADAARPPDPDASRDASTSFALTSPAFVDGGTLPATFTCDGEGVSPPLAWSGVPDGTRELALLMTTEARDGRKWNWVLHAIPASIGSIARGARDVGVAGLTSDGPLLQYSPPCSQGPGAKGYTFTLYALSGAPALPSAPNQVTGAVLEAAIAGKTLARASLAVSATRP
jgi:phosphatidylethanolamine-binding protein (PEBP) family uncharacterized protein